MKKFLIILLFLFLIILLSLMEKNETVIYVNSEKIVIGKKDTQINLTTYNSEFDTIITKKSGNAEIKVNGIKLKNGQSINLGKIEINKNNYIEIECRNNKIKLNTLPSTFPEYDVAGESKYDGDYYLTTYSFDYDGIHYIFKLNEIGKITYYKQTNMVAFDFKKVKNNNEEIRYLYLEATDTNYNEINSVLPCDLVVMNEQYEEIDRINYLNKNGITEKLENHTYLYLDDNHYILATYRNSKKVLYDKTVDVLLCVIEEIKDGEILWEFNSGEYEELYSYSLEALFPDYIHINSMAIDESDGNLLCSFRNIDSILKIDRNTGKLIWILGGIGDEFGLTEAQKFSKQHSVIYSGENTIILYDNGNANYSSRIVKIKLNEKEKNIESYEEYSLGVYAYMMGSIREIDKESDTYLICYGGGTYYKHSIQEINFSTGEVDFQFTFKKNRMMYNANKIK